MDVTLEHIAFEVEDAALSGTRSAPARALPGVLFVHGWGGSRITTWPAHARPPAWAWSA